jgi:ABC-2 type transport system ATP-binding protein
LHDLLAIQNQTDVVLENASPEFLQEIETLASKSGARLIEQSRSRTSLERLFLDATRSPDDDEGRNHE